MAIPPEPPVLSLATCGSRFVGPGTFFQAAGLAGLRWIDLELSGRAGSSGPEPIARAAIEYGVNLRAIWLPPLTGGIGGFGRTEGRVQLAGTLVAGTGARAIVVDRPNGQAEHDRRQARVLQEISEHVPRAARLTLALRPKTLEGNREHLADLAALRRLAEEWDFDLALDLNGPIDPTWESEAAVSKILPRLTVVRLGPLGPRPPGRGRERQTARVLAFLADLGYAGTIAVAAGAPFWRPDRAVTLARSCQDARRRILARFESAREEPRIDTSSRRGPGIEMPG